MAKKENPNLIFRKEWWDNLRHKSPELFKDALSILFSTYFDGKDFDPYAFDEQGSNPTPAQDLAIPMVKTAKINREAYTTKCERNSANAKKRFESQATACDRMQSQATACDRMQSQATACDRMRPQGNIIEGNVREGNTKDNTKDNLNIFPKSKNDNQQEKTLSEDVLSAKADPQPSGQRIFDYEEIVKGWNDIGCLPKIAKLTEQRKQKIKIRNSEISEAGFTWQIIFDKIRGTPFLLGQNNHNWQATFDWLISNPQNWLKIMEGNYDRQKQPTVNNDDIAAAVRLGYNSAGGDG